MSPELKEMLLTRESADTAERRHLEMMAATIAAGFVAHGFSYGDGESSSTWDHTNIPHRAVQMARAIQRESNNG